MDPLRRFSDSRQFLDALLSCIQHVVLLIDQQGKLLFANSVVEDIFGFTPDEITGENISLILNPEDLDHLYPNLLYMTRNGKPFEGEIALMRKDKGHFLAFVVFRPLSGTTPDRPIALVSVRDIDSKKKTNTRFSRTHYQDLIKLADGIAHEIRNPIVAIGGFARRLQKSCKAIDDDKYYDGIIDNVRRLEGLVAKVELFARLPKPCLKALSAKELIPKAAEIFLPETKKHNIDLTIDLEEGTLFLDNKLVLRAMSILIENAIDAIGTGGRILIQSTKEGNKYSVTINDTGRGISAQDLPYIFDPFFTTKPGGVGIDLAVVKRIVESHGGSVKVASKLGKGTTFILTFPLERRRSVRTCRFED